jgi:hypothetical protein
MYCMTLNRISFSPFHSGTNFRMKKIMNRSYFWRLTLMKQSHLSVNLRLKETQ